ncbi:MAG TPA: hypothetical protein DDW20_05840, partial [Firmicutes bacterium]|nr:hypothetical protein [Bacillota bacterium]
MKRIAKVASLCSLMLLGGVLTVTTINSPTPNVARAAALAKGDLQGGCEVKLQSTSSDNAATFVMALNGKYDLSGDGVFIRMKNLTG